MPFVYCSAEEHRLQKHKRPERKKNCHELPGNSCKLPEEEKSGCETGRSERVGGDRAKRWTCRCDLRSGEFGKHALRERFEGSGNGDEIRSGVCFRND